MNFSKFLNNLKKMNKMTLIHLVCVVLAVILAVHVVLFIKHHISTNPVEVPEKVMESILEEGTYKGVGHYSSTDLHPNGIKSDLVLNIKKSGPKIYELNIDVTLNDAKTGEFITNGVRKTTIEDAVNHKNQYFKNSKSYINGKLVSNSRGQCVNYSNNSLTIDSVGSWHISTHDYKQIKHKISRNGDKLVFDFYNYNVIIIPWLSNLTMREEYTKVQ